MQYYTKRTALVNLKPDAQWVWEGTDFKYENLKMIEGTKPTEDEIDAEYTRLTNLYNSQKYQRDRAAEYPSVVDQLDLIYHSGIDAWKAKIKETKDKYPKS